MRRIALLGLIVGCATPAKQGPPPPPPPPPEKIEAAKAMPDDEASAPGDSDGDSPVADSTGHTTGSGNLRGRKATAPQTRIGQPLSQGTLDKAIIRRYIKRVIGKISECYEKELLIQPNLEGKITIQFEITAEGKVGKSTGGGMPRVDACVAAVIQTIEFPKPQGGGSVQVTYPFTFRPAGE